MTVTERSEVLAELPGRIRALRQEAAEHDAVAAHYASRYYNEPASARHARRAAAEARQTATELEAIYREAAAASR